MAKSVLAFQTVGKDSYGVAKSASGKWYFRESVRTAYGWKMTPWTFVTEDSAIDSDAGRMDVHQFISAGKRALAKGDKSFIYGFHREVYILDDVNYRLPA